MTLATSPKGALSGSAHSDHAWLDRWPVILLICLGAIVPLVVVDFPPLVDLYGHLGRFAVQTDLANRPELQPYFSYEWKLIGNLGADILVQALHPLLGLEGAVRFVVILAQFLGALGLLLVSREIHGRVQPFALMAIPLLYGYPFNYGFINYALSMALALLAFAFWLRLQRSGRDNPARLWLAAAGALIWVCHTYGWAFLGLMCGSTLLADAITARTHPVAAVRRILGACWPLLLPVVPMVIWRAESSGAAMAGWSFQFKLNWLASPLRTEWRRLDLGALAVIAAVLVVLPMFGRHFAMNLRLRIAALLCFAFFFILPTKVFGSAFADMRLLPYAFMLGLLALAPIGLGRRGMQVVGVFALVFLAARLTITGVSYVEQDRRVQAVLPALEQMPKGARVAFFAVKPCMPFWGMPVLDHVAGAAMARRNAFVNDQWQQPGVNPLIVNYPAARPFVSDPSHLIQADNCSHRARPSIARTLPRIPAGAFTHVWLVGAVPATLAVPANFEPVPYRGEGKLYRIVPAAGQ